MKNTTIGKMIITGTAVMAAIITGCSRKAADIPNVDITAEISGEDAVSTEADEVNSVHSTTEGTSTAATKKSEVNSVHSTAESTKAPEKQSETTTQESTKAPEAQPETTTQAPTKASEAQSETTTQAPTKAPEAQSETTTQAPTKAPEAQSETTTQAPTKAPETQPETTTQTQTTAPETQPETTTQAPTEEVTEPSSEPALSDEEILANTPTYGDTYNVVVNGTRYYWKYDVGPDGAFLSTGRWMSETEYFAYLDEKQREYESELESRRAISWYDTHSEELNVVYYDEHGLAYAYTLNNGFSLPGHNGVGERCEDMGEYAEGRVTRFYQCVMDGWTYKNGKDVQDGMVRIEE